MTWLQASSEAEVVHVTVSQPNILAKPKERLPSHRPHTTKTRKRNQATYLLRHQRTLGHLAQILQNDAIERVEQQLAVRALAARDEDKQLLEVLLRLDALLRLAAGQVQLVLELRERASDQLLDGEVGAGRRGVGGADGEDVRDEVGLPQRDAVDDGSTPGKWVRNVSY